MSLGNLIQKCQCRECQTWLFKTPSGHVCPEGHGGIVGGITSGMIRRAKKLADVIALPMAVKVKRQWMIEGRPLVKLKMLHGIIDGERQPYPGKPKTGEIHLRTKVDRWSRFVYAEIKLTKSE